MSEQSLQKNASIWRLITVAMLCFATTVDGLAFTPRATQLQKSLINPHTSSDLGKVAASAALSLAILFHPMAAHADGQTKEFRLPPIDKLDKSRCTLSSSKMGQANAARDKLYDLRMCDLSGKDASGFDLSGVIMTDTNLSKTNFKEAQFSKAYLHDSNFDGADFTNGIIDRASFRGSTLRGAIFQNAVLTGTSFEGADVTGADFNEAAIGDFDIKSLCRNPTLTGENPVTGVDTYLSVGCAGLKKFK